MKLNYDNLINEISKAIKTSLNEMSKKIDHRTIDRSLWLSIASTCSRNKATECEFVKPMKKLTKDDLLNRYVGGLIILRKPCPQSEGDIEKLKSFKLLGQRAIELGATIEDIQNLYDINADNVKKPITKPVSSKEETDNHNKSITKNNVIASRKNAVMVDLYQNLDKLEKAFDTYDFKLFLDTFTDILKTFDDIVYPDDKDTKRNWSFVTGYDDTYSPEVYMKYNRVNYIHFDKGTYSYDCKDKVLYPRENLFHGMDRAKSWMIGYSYWDKTKVKARTIFIIQAKGVDQDALRFNIQIENGPNARMELFNALKEHFIKAYQTLTKLQHARNNFDESIYDMDKVGNNYIGWVAKYLPIILKNNGYTQDTWYDGLPINGAECEFWTGRLNTCALDGIRYWVGGDSTDDENKISYQEWTSTRPYSWYSSHANVSAKFDYDDKKVFSKKIYNYIKNLIKDGKLK